MSFINFHVFSTIKLGNNLIMVMLIFKVKNIFLIKCFFKCKTLLCVQFFYFRLMSIAFDPEKKNCLLQIKFKEKLKFFAMIVEMKLLFMMKFIC